MISVNKTLVIIVVSFLVGSWTTAQYYVQPQTREVIKYVDRTQTIIKNAEVERNESQTNVNDYRDKYERGLISLRQCEARKVPAKPSKVGNTKRTDTRDDTETLEKDVLNLADDASLAISQRDYWKKMYESAVERK